MPKNQKKPKSINKDKDASKASYEQSYMDFSYINNMIRISLEEAKRVHKKI